MRANWKPQKRALLGEKTLPFSPNYNFCCTTKKFFGCMTYEKARRYRFSSVQYSNHEHEEGSFLMTVLKFYDLFYDI